MDFSSSLKHLISAHEKECEQRREVERELKNVRLELDNLQTRLIQSELPQTEKNSKEAPTAMGNQLHPETENAPEHGTNVIGVEEHAHPGVGARNSKDEHAHPVAGARHSKDDGPSWHESNVHEFAMLKGWEGLTRRDADWGASTTEFISSLVSGRYTDKHKGKTQQNVVWLVETHTFEMLVVFAIVSNSFLIGAIGNYCAVNDVRSNDVPLPYVIAERIFTVLFTLELLTRLFAYRCEFFFGKHRSWNLFDFIVVGADVIQTIVESIFSDTGMDLSILRMLRIVRVTRAVRVIKVIRFFKELRMMIYSILRCGTSLLWSLLLFIAITYIFGIFLMAQVTDYLIEEGKDHPRSAKMKEYFHSVVETIYTLYACMSGGINWKEVSDDLNDIHWSNAVALAFYVFFTVFVVSNILTGIFVDTAIQSASSDREEIIQEQMANQESELMMLKTAFEEADADESGLISVKEFQTHLQDRSVRAHFASIGIEVHQAMGLFKLLDQDGSGEVGIEEFVMGCMRLKGGAKGIDLATLMYENKRMVERLKDLEAFCKEHFLRLEDFTQALSASFKAREYNELTV